MINTKTEIKGGIDDNNMDRIKRNKITIGTTERIMTGCGKLYITINRNNDNGIIEVFAALGKSGGCAMVQNEAITRLISIGLQYGVPTSEIIQQLTGLRCPSPAIDDGVEISSCPHAIALALSRRIKDQKTTNTEGGGGCDYYNR